MGSKFLITFCLIAASMAAGYGCRKLRLLPESVAAWLMTAISVFGYSLVGLLSIWTTPLHVTDAWLPLLGAVQMAALAWLTLPVGRWLTKDRGEVGLFAAASALGNCGPTMGGFVIFLLYGEMGLGLSNIYNLMFGPMVVLLIYPIARHHASTGPAGSLAKMFVRNLLDWRSIGLPITFVAIGLSLAGVPRPAFVQDYRVLDVLMYGLNFGAYFAIGLRLSLSRVPHLVRMIAGLSATRYVLSPVTGVALWALTLLTPWPMGATEHGTHLSRNVFFISTSVSTAVTCVAVANMFNLRPREASVLFVTNTLIYLAILLPVVLWLFGGPLR